VKRIVIGAAVAITIALVVAFAPVLEIPYQDTETYYIDDVSQPYEVTETYYETEPLSYEVAESYSDTEFMQVGKQTVVLGFVIKDGTADVATPTGHLTLENTDSVAGVIGVHFTFYAVDKLKVAVAGLGPPDFNSEDYAAAKDPDSYLASRNWGDLDWDRVAPLCKQYNVQEHKTLQPGVPAGFLVSNGVIDTSKMAWKWEYTITEAAKTIEKERTVTKYKQLERERTVIRYWKGSISEYLRSGFQPWERRLE
jgi:hypothetical protein